MNPTRSPPPADAIKEVSALIETLHRTGQRLEDLTGGEVDAVADRDGQPFMLRRAQDRLRRDEAAKQAALLDALPAHIALLDAEGRIVSVNESWRRFGSPGVIYGPGYAIGANFPAICDSAQGDASSDARQIAEGIHGVLGGRLKTFSLEYACHSTSAQRWFLISVTPMATGRPNGAVIMQLDVTAKHQAAQELRESERRFSDVLGNVQLISVMLDREARITYCNDYLLRLTGWRHEEVIGRSWVKLFIPPESGDLKDRLAALLLDQPDARHGENRILTRAGERRLIRWNNSVLRSGTGEVIGTASIGEDITEQMRGEDALRRFRAAMDVTADAIFLVSRKSMRFVEVNETACSLLGYTREEFSRMGPQDLATLTREQLESTFDAIIAGDGKSQQVEVRMRRKDGSMLLVEMRRRPQRFGDDWIIVSVMRDITERVQRDEDLRRFRAAMDISGDGIVLIDRVSMRYIDCNQMLCDFVGYTRQELLGMTPMDLFSASRETLERDYDSIIADSNSSATMTEGQYMHRDGSRISIETRRRALKTDEGWIIVGTVRDISERKKAEARIFRLNRVYAVLSRINALIVRARDRQELFREACEIAFHAGGFPIAWIGEVDRDAMLVKPVAGHNTTERFFAQIRMTFDEHAPGGMGVVGEAVRTCQPVIANDVRSDARITAKGVTEGDTRSLVVLPLVVAGETVGVLVMHSEVNGFFDLEEMKLLQELAGDIAFALDHIAKDERLNFLALERERNEEALLRFNLAMDATADAIYLVDRASMRFVHVNDAACRMRETTREELLELGPSTPRAELERIYDGLIASGADAKPVELLKHRSDGSEFWVEVRRHAQRSGERWTIVTLVRDITARREADARIAYLNRVHAMLGGINALIVRVSDRDELFREACRIAVEGGGFRMAMIAIVDRAAMSIVPVASSGANDEFRRSVEGLFSSSEGGLAGDTLTAQAIRQKKAMVTNDSQGDPAILLGRKHAKFGVRSMAMLPLIVSNEAVGALMLCASELEFFHAEELKLLTGLAENIAFAIDHIAKEAERREVEKRILRLNRVYAMLSGINTLIVRVRDREELFSEACRVAVEHGQFKMAWIGVVDRDAMKIVPVASAGAEPEFLALIQDRFSLREDAPHGNTRSARAVREKKPIVANTIGDPGDTTIFFAKERAERGIASMAVLPLLVADEAAGVLVLYAGEAGFFDQQEMKLLADLANDIAHAIDHIDKQERLDYLAFYDALTGLANRTLFLERLAQHMRSAVAGGHKLALYLVDLERFRNINDSLGRQAGDALLKQITDWLTRRFGDANLLGRVGADHFAVVLPEVKREGGVARLLEKAMAAFMEHPFRLDDAVFRVSVKAGIALFPDDGADADTLFRNAEAALKNAKASGERYLFYTQRMTETVSGNLTLENQLRQALEKEEFVLHYQPKVNLVSGKVTGTEALIRWNDPRTGLVPPGRFIPILEETGLIYDVGRWALRKAIQDYLRWRAAGLAAVRVSVNVSPLQLRNSRFVAEIQEAIGIDTHAAAGLDLEITESLIMEDIKHSIASLQAIRAMGVTVAIDDFGTGFSSLSYLSKLPVDTLKIDRSFVTDMTVAPGGLALVSTIINLAHSLNLNVVAEGVETQEQQRLLRLLRCDEMQGFLYSKPVPGELFEAKFLAPVKAP